MKIKRTDVGFWESGPTIRTERLKYKLSEEQSFESLDFSEGDTSG